MPVRSWPLFRARERAHAEIKSFSAPVTALAERYNITVSTVRKWKLSEDPQDRSYRPHKLSNTLTFTQEVLTVELRGTLLRRMDDLLVEVRKCINAAVSRSNQDRCLRHHGGSDLKSLQPELEGQAKPLKTFKDYEPDYLYVDSK